LYRYFHIEQLNSIKKAFIEINNGISPFSESASWRYKTHDEMRTFVLTLLLFVFGIAQGQQLELKGTSYGAVTSAMYKEAKLKVAVTPQEFHELTLAYPELKIFFANRMDYQDCMLGYGSVVRWELTEEEKRNLRNFVKRNGGKMPKYRPLKTVSPSPISPAPEAEAKTTEEEIEEQEPTVIIENIESASLPIDSPDGQIETEEELPQPLNKRSSREVLVTPPMKYEAGRLTMNGEGLPFREAKALSRVSDSDALGHFRKAGRLRAWNFLWGYTAALMFSMAIDLEEPAPAIIGAGISGMVVYREKLRSEAVEEAVFEYNSVLPGYK
jgi:hypothetical protein